MYGVAEFSFSQTNLIRNSTLLLHFHDKLDSE